MPALSAATLPPLIDDAAAVPSVSDPAWAAPTPAAPAAQRRRVGQHTAGAAGASLPLPKLPSHPQRTADLPSTVPTADSLNALSLSPRGGPAVTFSSATAGRAGACSSLADEGGGRPAAPSVASNSARLQARARRSFAMHEPRAAATAKPMPAACLSYQHEVVPQAQPPHVGVAYHEAATRGLTSPVDPDLGQWSHRVAGRRTPGWGARRGGGEALGSGPASLVTMEVDALLLECGINAGARGACMMTRRGAGWRSAASYRVPP